MDDIVKIVYLVYSHSLFQHLFLLSIFHILTWSYILKGDWCSDDWEGVWQFSDKFARHQDQVTGKIIKEEVIDFYENEIEKDGKKEKKKYKNRQFNPHIEFPGCVIRWLRLNLGSKYQVLGKNEKQHEIWGHVQSARKHHWISWMIQFLNTLLAYFFLRNVVDDKLAFLAILLFSIHPVSVQVTAWISGIGYLLSLTWLLLSLNIVYWIPNPLIHTPIIAFLTFLSACNLLSGMANFIVLAFLGFWWAALAAVLVSIYAFSKQGLEVIRYRVKAFVDQNMGKSTNVTWRKPILMLKSFYYYIKLLMFPKRLGLYHEWGYHYDEKIDRWDWMSTKGLACLGLCLFLFIFGPMPIKLGVLWMVIYLSLFLNLVTAQQTVADRYAFLSSLGFSILIAFLFQNSPVLYTFIFTLYLMRTWVHLPTFDNEVKFYQSNCWNFNSEVALGNLGVTYQRLQLFGMAFDSWRLATRLYDGYDVPHYNLYSAHLASGNLTEARNHLQKCLSAKVCHFDKIWKKDMENIDRLIYLNRPIKDHLKDINKQIMEVKP